jgi:hypothetical protein
VRKYKIFLFITLFVLAGCSEFPSSGIVTWDTSFDGSVATPTAVAPSATPNSNAATVTPTYTPTRTPTETPTEPVHSDTITVENAGFEQPYTYRDMSQYVATGWTNFYRPQGEASWQYGACEWKEATSPYDDRVYEGDSSQQWFSFYKTQECGIQQTITGIEPGRPVRVTVVFMVWSSAYDDATISEDPSQASAFIGKADGDSVLWTSEDIDWYGELLLERGSDIPGNATAPHYWYDEWNSMYYEFTPESDTFTLFFKTICEYPIKHTDVYVGLVKIEYIDAAEPVPTIESYAEYVVSVSAGVGANIRECADDSVCEVIATVPNGTLCHVNSDADNWYGVTCYPEGEDDMSGYMWSALLARLE